MKILKSGNARVIMALTLIHFTGDFYSSFTSPLFPAYVEKLGLTMAQIGLIAGLSRFLAFIVQPSMGYLADQYRTRFFILGGLLLPIVFIPLTGLAPCFWILLLFTALGSVGSSMFHPSVAGMVTLYARNNMGVAMSIFNMGGTLSFAIGPLFITWFVASYGLEAAPVTMIIGLVVLLFLYRVVPMPREEGFKKLGFIGSIKNILGPVWKPIFLIWLVMVLRALISQSFLTFLPVYYARQGYSLISIGTLVALFTVAGALSGLLGGYIGDKVGYKIVFIVNFALMAPVLFLFLHLTGNWIYPGVFLAGFFLLAAMPLGVVMAQELVPNGRAMVSSLMMGLAYGIGGIMTPVVGKLADIFSIREVLFYMSFLPVLILVIVFFFPGPPVHRRAS